jgi:hypothetical protein
MPAVQTPEAKEAPKAAGPKAQVKFRMADAKKALSTIKTAAQRIAFQVAQDRMVEDAYDRMPPIDPAELDKANEGWRTNVDYGDTEVAINEKTEALCNLMTMPMPLIGFKTRQRTMHPTTLDNLNLVGLEYDFLMTETPMWTMEGQKMAHNMVATGLGILVHPDPYSWHFESHPRCNLIYPTRAGLNPEKWSWMALRKNISITELIKKLDPESEAAAAAMGWKMDKVKSLINNLEKGWGSEGIGHNKADMTNDPEGYVNALQTNDVYFSSCNGDDIKGFTLLVKEWDGKITEHILVEDEKIGFIYSGNHRYDSMTDYIHLFPLSLGQGYLEKVRGLGHRVLPFNALINDLRNRSVDVTILSGGLMLKGTKEDGVRDLTDLMLGGLVTMIPDTYELDQRSFGNPAQGMIQLEQGLRGYREANNRVFGGATGAKQPEITATHAKLKYAEDTKANGFETDRFYVQLTQFHRAVWKRLQYFADKGKASVPCAGRDEALAFWKELKEQGVKPEDLKAIRSVTANSVFGDGDPAQVFLALQDLSPLLPSLPITAQRQAMKLMIAARTRKPYLAEEWLPSNNRADVIKSSQLWRINMENDCFENGSPSPTQDDDISSIHAEEHTKWAEEVIKNFEQQVLKPDESLKRLILCRDHTTVHMGLLGRSKADEGLFRDLGQRWAQIINMMRRMEQMVRDQQAAEQERQLQELRQPSLTVEQKEKILTGEFQRQQIAMTEEHKRMEITATEQLKRDNMTKDALTKAQLAVIESVPVMGEAQSALASDDT